MDDPKLEGGHAPPPETRRVTSAGDPDLQVAWDRREPGTPEQPLDLTEAGHVATPATEASHPQAGLADLLRQRPRAALLAAGLLGLACGVLASPAPQVLRLSSGHRRLGPVG